jgi:hypothetical protein
MGIPGGFLRISAAIFAAFCGCFCVIFCVLWEAVSARFLRFLLSAAFRSAFCVSA